MQVTITIAMIETFHLMLITSQLTYCLAWPITEVDIDVDIME